jgi:hypothetical protein
MARPTRNDVDYFPFMCKEGKGMYVIEEKYGNDGFATWIKILRSLATTNFHYLNLSDPSEKMFLSAKCKISQNVLESIIDDLINLGEFDKELWDEFSILYSEKFIESIEDAYKKRNNSPLTKKQLLDHLSSLGVTKPSKSVPKPSLSPLKGSDNPQSKVKYSKVKEKKEDLEERKQNYKPDFDKLFSKINSRIHQDWIVESFESFKSFSPRCEETVMEFVDGTMKRSIFEFCKSCGYNSIKFYSESGAINYWKEASKGYISDIDSWRKKLKAMKKRNEEQTANIR